MIYARALSEASEGMISEFQSLFRREIDCYHRLLRLSIRQNRYMRAQDSRRLEANTEEWDRYLPIAESARMNRLEAMNRLFDIFQIKHRDSGPQPLIAYLPCEAGEKMRKLCEQWNATIADLSHRNVLNGMLAQFCLETVKEEARIFRSHVAGKDGGCYDGQGLMSPSQFKGSSLLIEQV